MSLQGPKHIVESGALSALRFSKLYKLFAPALSGKGSIFMFHRIVKKEDKSSIVPLQDLEVTPEYLERIINYCNKNNYEIISLDTLYEQLLNGKFSKRFAVFTFDDGYKDNYTLAYPIFKKYNAPFAIYVTNCFPDGTAKIWWYALEELFRQQKNISFEFLNQKYEFVIQDESGIIKVYNEIEKLITDASDKNINELYEKIFYDNGITLESIVGKFAMSWDDIKKISKDNLVTIGAHTITHRSLKQLRDKECYDEMANSKELIEQHTNKKVEHFSYPFGSSNFAGEREFNFAKKIGFKTATTTRKGHIFPVHVNMLTALPRIQIDERDMSVKNFESYFMSGIYQYYKNGFKLVNTN